MAFLVLRAKGAVAGNVAALAAVIARGLACTAVGATSTIRSFAGGNRPNDASRSWRLLLAGPRGRRGLGTSSTISTSTTVAASTASAALDCRCQQRKQRVTSSPLRAGHLGGLRTLGASDNIEFNHLCVKKSFWKTNLSIGKAAKTLRLDGTLKTLTSSGPPNLVNKHVSVVVRPSNEPKSLGDIEPLHCPGDATCRLERIHINIPAAAILFFL